MAVPALCRKHTSKIFFQMPSSVTGVDAAVRGADGHLNRAAGARNQMSPAESKSRVLQVWAAKLTYG